jgi:Arc/MetJ family transcription regulator
MKKTLNIDEELLREAKEACGASTDTEVVKKGLEALVRHAAYQRIKSYFGMEPDAVDVPRRREKPAPGRGFDRRK